MKNKWCLFVLRNKTRKIKFVPLKFKQDNIDTTKYPFNFFEECKELSYLRLMYLRKGDIVSFPIFQYFTNITAVKAFFGHNFEWLSREWIYKNKLFEWLKLPHWRIFGVYMDNFKYMGDEL